MAMNLAFAETLLREMETPLATTQLNGGQPASKDAARAVHEDCDPVVFKKG